MPAGAITGFSSSASPSSSASHVSSEPSQAAASPPGDPAGRIKWEIANFWMLEDKSDSHAAAKLQEVISLSESLFAMKEGCLDWSGATDSRGVVAIVALLERSADSVQKLAIAEGADCRIQMPSRLASPGHNPYRGSHHSIASEIAEMTGFTQLEFTEQCKVDGQMYAAFLQRGGTIMGPKLDLLNPPAGVECIKKDDGKTHVWRMNIASEAAPAFAHEASLVLGQLLGDKLLAQLAAEYVLPDPALLRALPQILPSVDQHREDNRASMAGWQVKLNVLVREALIAMRAGADPASEWSRLLEAAPRLGSGGYVEFDQDAGEWVLRTGPLSALEASCGPEAVKDLGAIGLLPKDHHTMAPPSMPEDEGALSDGSMILVVDGAAIRGQRDSGGAWIVNSTKDLAAPGSPAVWKRVEADLEQFTGVTDDKGWRHLSERAERQATLRKFSAYLKTTSMTAERQVEAAEDATSEEVAAVVGRAQDSCAHLLSCIESMEGSPRLGPEERAELNRLVKPLSAKCGDLLERLERVLGEAGK